MGTGTPEEVSGQQATDPVPLRTLRILPQRGVSDRRIGPGRQAKSTPSGMRPTMVPDHASHLDTPTSRTGRLWWGRGRHWSWRRRGDDDHASDVSELPHDDHAGAHDDRGDHDDGAGDHDDQQPVPARRPTVHAGYAGRHHDDDHRRVDINHHLITSDDLFDGTAIELHHDIDVRAVRVFNNGAAYRLVPADDGLTDAEIWCSYYGLPL